MSIRRRKFLQASATIAASGLGGCSNLIDGGALPNNGDVYANKPATSPPAIKKPPAPDRPNVLLLCIDDLNDWVGYLNSHPGVYTPHIDKLRAQSVSFNRAYCSVPVCQASRGSALWGISPTTAALNGSQADFNAYQRLVKSDTAKPLPVWFSDAGYETISTGKVFHFVPEARKFFELFLPYEPPSFLSTIGNSGTFFNYGTIPADSVHVDQRSTNFAIEQFKYTNERPWFAAIGLQQPHLPWRVPQWAFDLHPLDQVVMPEVPAEDWDDIPDSALDLIIKEYNFNNKKRTQHELVVESGLWKEHVQAYLACCSHTDAMVGQILTALDNSEYADNTAVVLWSDHGYHLGEKMHWRKMALWERATRIPFLIRAPWTVEANSSFEEPVSLLDLAPTLLNLANISPPAQFEGQSLLNITREEARARPANMYWHSAVSTRLGNLRWTRYADGGEELYDLHNDPHEHRNLLGKSGRHVGGIDALREMAS